MFEKLTKDRIQLRKDLNIRTHRVTCCWNCPFYNKGHTFSGSKTCMLRESTSSFPNTPDDDRAGIPKWCPRRGQDVIYVWNNE